LRSLVVPANEEWELLVVNNNSSDATDEVIRAFQGFLPLRRVFEGEVGLSRARNAGVRAATGELILFTDDDVLVAPNWMTAYLDALKLWPDAGYFGGVIRPWFAVEVPDWVKRNQTDLAGMLCSLDIGPVSREFGPENSPTVSIWPYAERCFLWRRSMSALAAKVMSSCAVPSIVSSDL
jgi:glycosyltransferase involved in cell wall biosynthesis